MIKWLYSYFYVFSAEGKYNLHGVLFSEKLVITVIKWNSEFERIGVGG